MHNFSLITNVAVDLRGNRSFPIAGYAGDPVDIEAEVEQHILDILSPGDPEKDASERRMPYAQFPCSDALLPSECGLVFRHKDGNIVMEFRGAQRNVLFKGYIPVEELLDATQNYREIMEKQTSLARKACLRLERLVPDFRTRPLTVQPGDSEEIKMAKAGVSLQDSFRQSLHTYGSGFIKKTLSRQEIILHSQTLGPSLEMRVYALTSFLVSEPNQESVCRSPYAAPRVPAHKFHCVSANRSLVCV